jgi:AcrR family transcriptional regulator
VSSRAEGASGARRERPDARNHILETAWSLTRERGVHAVTVADIAAASGVSRQLVYHHFDSRAGLLVAMARYHDAAVGFRVRVAQARSLPPVEALEALVRMWCEYIPDILPVARALEAAMTTGDEGGAAWRDRMDDIHEAFRLAVGRVATMAGWRPAGTSAPRPTGSSPAPTCRPGSTSWSSAGGNRRPTSTGPPPRSSPTWSPDSVNRSGPGPIPASALSPRRRGCPLDPGPIDVPAAVGSGPPRMDA